MWCLTPLHPQEKLTGVVVIAGTKKISHSGFNLQAVGRVVPQVSASTVGIFEALYSSVKPVELMREELCLTTEELPAGRTELPFEVLMQPLAGRTLAETYHGVYLNVVYEIRVELLRTGFQRNLESVLEFVMEVPTTTPIDPKPVEFSISPSDLGNIKEEAVSALPSFLVTGKLNQTNAFLNDAFIGEITVDSADSKISSIELQLVRVETVTYSEGSAREATEIQNLQLAEGDITRGLAIPIYMLLPRLFTCPTTVTDGFSCEFEVNLMLCFEDGYMVTENFPIALYR